MVGSNLINLANDAGSETAPTGKLQLRSRYQGYEYVPSLKLYVSDKLAYEGRAFISVRRQLEKHGSSILSPLEFWEYYDYCKEKRPDIIEKLKTSFRYEYLDAIFNTDHQAIIIKPEFTKNREINLSKRTYDCFIPKDTHYFSRGDVSELHGYPDKSNREEKEFCLFGYEQHRSNYSCILTSMEGKIALAQAHTGPNESSSSINENGVRLCFTENNMKNEELRSKLEIHFSSK